MTPDVIVLNADIRTMDPARPRVQAIAIRAGRILALGDDAGIRRLRGPATRMIDAGGHMILPGFQDAHVHLMDGGTDLIQSAQLYDVTTVAALQSALAAHAARFDGPLVMGVGWQCGWFGDANLTRAVLDAVVPDRPCIVYDGNFHNACLNSAALAMAGIDADTPDPRNGHILRAGGQPTGMLHEEAIHWARQRLPGISAATYIAGARAGMAHANRHGITGILDPSVEARHLRAYGGVETAGDMTLRVTGAAYVMASEPVAEAVARLVAIRRDHASDLFHIHSAKVFLDGGLENRTAAMIAPYSDAAGGNAPLMFAPDHIAALFTALDAARFQIHVHCIGDMAVRAALDGFEAARAANGPWPGLHQIAHVQVVDLSDMPRFATLGVMANCQPLWAALDPAVPDHTMAMVGADRLPFVYPFRSLIDAGAPYCLSSDFAVTTLNPFEIIETAVTRLPPRARGPAPVFGPYQRITVAEALAGYTTHAAAAMWRPDTGALRVGMRGDLIVIDRDILTCEAQDIGSTRVLLTLFQGAEVWRDPVFVG